jgi:hypothetical protein
MTTPCLFLRVAALACALSPAVLAHDEPASLLVFPEFDTHPASSTIVTVTNTNPDVKTGTVDVEYRYIDGENCIEFNRTERLTANDTISVSVKHHNPNQQEGYLYVFAKSTTTGKAIHFNWLIGTAMTINGIVLFDTSYNPYNFQAVNAGGPGTPTDVDGDGQRDLNDVEYSAAPAELLIPRFFGQTIVTRSHLVLINLTGGKAFTAIVDFLVYNDNEEVLSAQYSFECWDKVELAAVSGVFDNEFLHDNTADDPDELVGFSHVETGWMRLDGNTAFSTATSFSDPAILAVLTEALTVFGAADLPYINGTQTNGDLLHQGPFGDTDDTP